MVSSFLNLVCLYALLLTLIFLGIRTCLGYDVDRLPFQPLHHSLSRAWEPGVARRSWTRSRRRVDDCVPPLGWRAVLLNVAPLILNWILVHPDSQT